MSHDVFTLGEAMLRLSPPAGVPLDSTALLDLHVAGSEANVAVALAALDRSVAWYSKLPENRLGRRVARDLRAAGVDLSMAEWLTEGRLGTYFVELDNGPRGTSVIYDRRGSAASRMTPDDVPWEAVAGARVVHLSGITPALSDSCRDTTLAVAEAAKASASLVSLDVNHRARLWGQETARTVLSKLAEGVDLLICTREDALTVFGISSPPGDAALELADMLDSSNVVVTEGPGGAVLARDGSTLQVPARPTMIVDRLGAGDAFAAGLLDGLLDGDIEAGMQRGVALAAVALATSGDQVRIDRRELDHILTGRERGVDR
ncbi:MAG: sugar kinase [Acidimicrobiia bacterium]